MPLEFDPFLKQAFPIDRNDLNEANLNSTPVRNCYFAIKKNDVAALRGLFNLLSPQQKKGLLNFPMDSDDFDRGGPFSITEAYVGTPLQIAEKMKRPEVLNFFKEVKTELESQATTAITKQGSQAFTAR